MMELYEFQREDVDKIYAKGCGLIGSEMGTGKTLEAIKLDEAWYRNGAGPTLVITPLNTFNGWQEKYGILAPSTDLVTIDRKNRDTFLEAIRRKRGDVFLMHWDALKLMPELSTFGFNTIIADECHRAANRKAQVTQALFRLKARHRLAISGTASGDKPQNLWAVNHFVWPTYYRSFWRFWKHYIIEGTETGKQGQQYRKVLGVKNVQSLKAEMDPWYVRHLKRDPCCLHHPQGVMPWLPEKSYDRIWVELSPKQRKFYEQMRRQMVAWIGENEDNPLVAQVAVAQLTRLSQMALATPDFEGDKIRLGLPSAKAEALLELVKDNPGKQFVVYSASKQMCYLTSKYMAEHGISSFVLSGDTPQAQREGMVDRFARGDTQLFIGVIEAAAEGIDGLQHATDTAVFLDRSWRTIKNKQAEDRLHRDGQKDTVQIIDIMAKNTVDMGRWQKLEAKWEWIRTILGDQFDNTSYANTIDTLEEILGVGAV